MTTREGSRCIGAAVLLIALGTPVLAEAQDGPPDPPPPPATQPAAKRTEPPRWVPTTMGREERHWSQDTVPAPLRGLWKDPHSGWYLLLEPEVRDCRLLEQTEDGTQEIGVPWDLTLPAPKDPRATIIFTGAIHLTVMVEVSAVHEDELVTRITHSGSGEMWRNEVVTLSRADPETLSGPIRRAFVECRVLEDSPIAGAAGGQRQVRLEVLRSRVDLAKPGSEWGLVVDKLRDVCLEKRETDPPDASYYVLLPPPAAGEK